LLPECKSKKALCYIYLGRLAEEKKKDGIKKERDSNGSIT
jgi:hypothetical protein